ncbi:hypothetical protein [Streptomyces sp. NPDC050264]|uniref:hypothetical protein n=1 Tax=Streptomyces sp. NPDC050264 TaxID=3155038 RepID=UPI00341D870A
MVHIPFIAIPAVPVIVICSPSAVATDSFLASVAVSLTAAIGRLVWNFTAQYRRVA